MGSKLSCALLGLGFFSVLGTTEHAGGSGQEVIVKRGTPFTWDYNNGVTVVYDEEGRPWIRRGSVGSEEIATLPPCTINPGAYVPHSNDGGYFVREVLPNL